MCVCVCVCVCPHRLAHSVRARSAGPPARSVVRTAAHPSAVGQPLVRARADVQRDSDSRGRRHGKQCDAHGWVRLSRGPLTAFAPPLGTLAVAAHSLAASPPQGCTEVGPLWQGSEHYPTQYCFRSVALSQTRVRLRRCCSSATFRASASSSWFCPPVALLALIRIISTLIRTIRTIIRIIHTIFGRNCASFGP